MVREGQTAVCGPDVAAVILAVRGVLCFMKSAGESRVIDDAIFFFFNVAIQYERREERVIFGHVREGVRAGKMQFHVGHRSVKFLEYHPVHQNVAKAADPSPNQDTVSSLVKVTERNWLLGLLFHQFGQDHILVDRAERYF